MANSEAQGARGILLDFGGESSSIKPEGYCIEKDESMTARKADCGRGERLTRSHAICNRSLTQTPMCRMLIEFMI
jgi:hypothetical protein